MDITGIDPFKIRAAIDSFQSTQSKPPSTTTQIISPNSLFELPTGSTSAPVESDEVPDEMGELGELVDAVQESLDVSAPLSTDRMAVKATDSSADVLCRQSDLDHKLEKQLSDQQCSSSYLKMLSSRQKLPVFARREVSCARCGPV